MILTEESAMFLTMTTISISTASDKESRDKVEPVIVELNFDVRSPVWHRASSKIPTPSFEEMEGACGPFFFRHW